MAEKSCSEEGVTSVVAVPEGEQLYWGQEPVEEMSSLRGRRIINGLLQRSDLVEIIGSDHFYISIQDGVDAFLAEQVEQPDEAVPPETEESD